MTDDGAAHTFKRLDYPKSGPNGMTLTTRAATENALWTRDVAQTDLTMPFVLVRTHGNGLTQ